MEAEEIKRMANGLDNTNDPESDNRVDKSESNEGKISRGENETEGEGIGHAQKEPELVEEADVQLTDEELEIAEKLHNNTKRNEREKLPSIKKMNKIKVLEEMQ